MQVFKTFLKIAKKKFPSVLLYYIIFTVIVIAMSKIGASDHETSFTATKADIYIIDEDDSTASHALSRIGKSSIQNICSLFLRRIRK